MRTPPELLHACDQVGEFIKFWGFKKIDGVIWAHIFLAPKPISPKEIMERLKISKAQVSLSLKELQKYGVVVEDGKGEYGTSYYKSAEDLGEVIKGVLRERETKILSDILSASLRLKDAYKIANVEKWAGEDKTDQLISMVQLASLFLMQIVSQDSSLNALNIGEGESTAS